MNTVQLTQEGHDKLMAEYRSLTDVKKPAVIERLQRARAMGDLSENSEYTAAREELNFVDGRIAEINEILKHGTIVGNQKNGNTVALGSKIKVETDRGQTDEYIIVGEFEADPMNKKLSSTSPIGQALLGKKTGDQVEINIPAGKTSYKILAIS